MSVTNAQGAGWDELFGGTGQDRARDVQRTSDGGYIIAGATSSFGSVLNDGWLVKIDDPLMTRISLVSPPDEADRVGARRRKRQRLCR